MPRGDMTGPMGAGPMTGRKMGYCAGYSVPGYASCRCGSGRGRGRMYYITGLPGWARHTGYSVPVTDEREFLMNQADYLENQLKSVREQLSGFDKAE